MRDSSNLKIVREEGYFKILNIKSSSPWKINKEINWLFPLSKEFCSNSYILHNLMEYPWKEEASRFLRTLLDVTESETNYSKTFLIKKFNSTRSNCPLQMSRAF